MGEHVTLKNGDQIKLGTCEDYYYTRADQLPQVMGRGEAPKSIEQAEEWGIRFRFPFPDEDKIEIGQFEDYNRSFKVSNTDDMLEGVEHYKIQFKADVKSGMLLSSLPCPASKEAKAFEEGDVFKIHRNGNSGSGIAIRQQKYIDGKLWTVCECVDCGHAFRLPPDEGEMLAVKLRSMADSYKGHKPSTYYDTCHAMADRVLAGYGLGPEGMPEAANVIAFSA